MGGTKPSRNEPCPCGSGKKFKRCHGGPNADYEEMISRGAEEAQRRAEIHWIQQQRQQGLGRPIIAAQTAGKRLVAVGHRLFQGAWLTFHDFLYSYIFDVLGRDWFEAQTQLGQDERHPVIDWHERLLAASKASNLAPGETRQTPMTGAISAFLTLAYDLYTLEHNNDQTRTPALRKSLIGRLKSQDQFIGVRYEIRVAAMLLRAGFELEWENETDRRSKHVEYTAIYPRTGKAFGVECKIRNQDVAKKSNQHLGKFAGLVSDALRKTTPHDRLIFVDLNTQAFPYVPGGPHDWRTISINTLRKFEGQPKAEPCRPPWCSSPITPTITTSTVRFPMREPPLRGSRPMTIGPVVCWRYRRRLRCAHVILRSRRSWRRSRNISMCLPHLKGKFLGCRQTACSSGTAIRWTMVQ